MQLRKENWQNMEETQQIWKGHKNTYEFNLERSKKITICSNFDSGNIALLKQVTQFHYRLEAVHDCKSKQNVPRKTWFHFRVSAPKNLRIRFTLENVTIYESMYNEYQWGRPVFKDESGIWLPIKDSFLTYREQVGLVFDHTFLSDSPVYFALSIPFSYHDNQAYLCELADTIPPSVRYSDEIIAITKQSLNVHCLSITDRSTCQSDTKPFVLITCRVHPGETGSSFCLMGILDFLTRSFNLQADLLLKMFEFIIFPMVNPDGVFAGNYRMDLNRTNLNRVYNEPSPDLHPSIYAIKQQILKRMKNFPLKKIVFHFDLHSHSNLKPAFVYGNAFDDIVTQTQSTLFCKILQHNSQIFSYLCSQFTERHMKMKDRGQTMTKQGCARVVLSKLANITYSYTVETSIFPYPTHQTLQSFSNESFCNDEKILFEEELYLDMSMRFSTKNDMVLDNIKLGYGILISILDLFEKNPYSRIVALEEVLEAYRKQISQNMLSGDQKFRLIDTKAYQKARMISKLAKEEFMSKYQKGWNFLANHNSMNKIKWPFGMKWFEELNEDKKGKKQRRARTETEGQTNPCINTKNYRKRIMNFEHELILQQNLEGELIKRQGVQLPIVNDLPSTKKIPERNSLPSTDNKKSSQDNQLFKIGSCEQSKQKGYAKPAKNIVLSFIHEQVEKISSKVKRVNQKNIITTNKFGNLKSIQNTSSNSLSCMMKTNSFPQKKKNIESGDMDQRRREINVQKKSQFIANIIDSKKEAEKSGKILNTVNYTYRRRKEQFSRQKQSKSRHAESNKKEENFVKYSEGRNKQTMQFNLTNNNIRLPQLCIDARITSISSEIV